MSHTNACMILPCRLIVLLTNLESLGSGGVHSGLESHGSVGKHFVEENGMTVSKKEGVRRWVLVNQSVIIEFANAQAAAQIRVGL